MHRIKTRIWFWLIVPLAVIAAAPGSAEIIRFGYGGSIHGGSSWEIRPDDTVVFSAYQAIGPITDSPNWVWDNKPAKQGHVSFVIPQSFARASEIVIQRIGDAQLGAAPAYQSGCLDTGSLIVEVDIAALQYTAILDTCIDLQDQAPRKAKKYYAKVLETAKELNFALGLDGLLEK